MPYQRYLVQNGRVNISGGKCLPHYGSVVSLPKVEEVKVEKEVVGNGISPELSSRLNALNIKKHSTDLQSRLMAVDPKKKLINFTI
jgi:hypothetical protein